MSYLYRQPVFDLFGEVPVTEDDLHAWVEAVSPVHYTDRLFERYVRAYDVAGKVRRAKVEGRFDQIISQRRTIWHARLALAQIV